MTKSEVRVMRAELDLMRYYLDMMDIYDAIRVINLPYAVAWWEENLLNIVEVLYKDCDYREKYDDVR